MSMDPNKIWFTFPDKTLSYECRGCGACCKGLGIGFDAVSGELDALVAREPALVGFAQQRGAAWTAINPRGRCFFLDDGGMCRVETDHGREAKPASCRLFPFNRVFRLGAWTIIDYNSVICPLTHGQASALSGLVDHSDVLSEIDGIKDPAVVGTSVSLSGVGPDALMKAERAIARACFADNATVDSVLCAQDKGAGAAKKAIEAAFQAVLGRPWRAPGPETLQNALILTPSMRFNELFGPRRPWSHTETLAIMGRLWLVWLGALADAETLAGRPIDMQQATGLWAAQMPLAYAMARWDKAVIIGDGEIEIAADGERKARILAFAKACHANRRAQKPLGALLKPSIRAQTPAERVATLRAMMPLLPRLGLVRRRR